MTTLYRPVRISTVEQAEALPEGTIAKHPEYRTAAVKTDLCEEGIALWYDTDDGSQTATSLLGWTALVPVEAEEETTERIKYSPRGYEADVYSEVRLVTLTTIKEWLR